ncbi:hypothetical protein [Spiroplasma sp. DGKH1]|uniref:hypothetical protein n=1 Tax=Spiroplasma sp. DGKH1 TaxID=3050074 RepID=UPI0034C6B943
MIDLLSLTTKHKILMAQLAKFHQIFLDHPVKQDYLFLMDKIFDPFLNNILTLELLADNKIDNYLILFLQWTQEIVDNKIIFLASNSSQPPNANYNHKIQRQILTNLKIQITQTIPYLKKIISSDDLNYLETAFNYSNLVNCIKKLFLTYYCDWNKIIGYLDQMKKELKNYDEKLFNNKNDIYSKYSKKVNELLNENYQKKEQQFLLDFFIKKLEPGNFELWLELWHDVIYVRNRITHYPDSLVIHNSLNFLKKDEYILIFVYIDFLLFILEKYENDFYQNPLET